MEATLSPLHSLGFAVAAEWSVCVCVCVLSISPSPWSWSPCDWHAPLPHLVSADNEAPGEAGSPSPQESWGLHQGWQGAAFDSQALCCMPWSSLWQPDESTLFLHGRSCWAAFLNCHLQSVLKQTFYLLRGAIACISAAGPIPWSSKPVERSHTIPPSPPPFFSFQASTFYLEAAQRAPSTVESTTVGKGAVPDHRPGVDVEGPMQTATSKHRGLLLHCEAYVNVQVRQWTR